MDIHIEWLGPFDLRDGAREGLIYSVPDIEGIPDEPGVYVFVRVHGRKVSPLYIGRAERLARRIPQQLNNVRLMRGIENARGGYRTLHVGLLVRRQAQNVPRVIRTVEAALISTAYVEGHELLNVQGTRTLVHSITSRGNREARKWLPDNTINLQRGA